MHPSRPPSIDPNAAYRDANAAFADNRVYEQEEKPDDALHYDAAQNVPNLLAERNPRRTTNQDRLNNIAHNLGSGVRIVMEWMTPSTFPPPVTDAATSSASSVTISTIRNYLREKGYTNPEWVCQGLSEANAQNRLDSANVSAQTFLTALQIAHTINHPLLERLRVSDEELKGLIARLTGIVMTKAGFRPSIKTLVLNAHNNPDQLIANVLEYVRNPG